ncbi:MAG: hypothetical protein LBJ04_03125 [Sphingobacterium sp.]|jgi:hypothetical protein|nr:hypothetical protein [Sphingobacterium sp.]
MTANKDFAYRLIDDITYDLKNNSADFACPSVENGSMGLAIYFLLLYETRKDPEFLTLGEQLIEQSITNLTTIIGSEAYEPYYRGDCLANIISSFGRGLLFIENRFDLSYDFVGYHDSIHDALEPLLLSDIEIGDFDFFSGALSSGYYYLNRYCHTRCQCSAQVLRQIAAEICKKACFLPGDAVCWESVPYAFKVYLGLSHGSAMIINFLTKLFKLKILTPGNNPLEHSILEKAVNFVMAQIKDDPEGIFPHFSDDVPENDSGQFTLCYGDLGVVFALVQANFVLDNQSLNIKLPELLVAISRRKFNINHTFDGGILYGCSGIYQIFKLLHQQTGFDCLKGAKEYWYSEIFNRRDLMLETRSKFTMGLPQFDLLNKTAKYSFAWGIAGIGCTLLHHENAALPDFYELLITG